MDKVPSHVNPLLTGDSICIEEELKPVLYSALAGRAKHNKPARKTIQMNKAFLVKPILFMRHSPIRFPIQKTCSPVTNRSFKNLVRQLAGNSGETALAPLALRRHLSVTLPFSYFFIKITTRQAGGFSA
jgi:hypothetical protein